MKKTGAESLRLSAPVFGRCLIYTEIEALKVAINKISTL